MISDAEGFLKAHFDKDYYQPLKASCEQEKALAKEKYDKMDLDKELQRIKDRRHAAFAWQYHLIDMLRLSKFTFMETRAQKWENYKYTFNRRTFLLAERSVYCHHPDFHRTVYRCSGGEECKTAYL